MREVQVFFEGDYEYDGMGRLVIERIWQYDKTAKRMLITRETRTAYDLMGNPTEIKYYDVDGFAFTEQRTYARGGQLTGFSIPTTAGNVTVDTAGSYTYDTNNNMTGTKKLDAYRTISGTNYKIVFRAQWTFAFDRKNRLKTHTYPSGLNVRGNIWYDGIGRVWERWNDDSVTGDWDADLQRFVYDGAALAQEHTASANHETNEHTAWAYTYGRCEVDYLRKPDGIRQKVNDGVGGWDEHFLFNDAGYVASRTPSGSSTTITRTLRTASGDRLNDNPRMTAGLTSGSFNNISNLAKPNSYIESYGGGTELGTSSLGFDSLEQSGPVHQLPALGGMILNSPPAGGGPGGGGSTFGDGIPVGGGGGGLGVPSNGGAGGAGRRLVDPSRIGGGQPLQDVSGAGSGGAGTQSFNEWLNCRDENGDLVDCSALLLCVVWLGGSNPIEDLCCPGDDPQPVANCLAIVPDECLDCLCLTGYQNDCLCDLMHGKDFSGLTGLLQYLVYYLAALEHCRHSLPRCCTPAGSAEMDAEPILWKCEDITPIVCLGRCKLRYYDYNCHQDPCEDNLVLLWELAGRCESPQFPECYFTPTDNPHNCKIVDSDNNDSWASCSYFKLTVPDCETPGHHFPPKHWIPPLRGNP